MLRLQALVLWAPSQWTKHSVGCHDFVFWHPDNIHVSSRETSHHRRWLALVTVIKVVDPNFHTKHIGELTFMSTLKPYIDEYYT